MVHIVFKLARQAVSVRNSAGCFAAAYLVPTAAVVTHWRPRGWASSSTSTDGGNIITDSEVESVARLACLKLPEAGGIEVVKCDLSRMLRFVSVMDAVDVQGVEPMWTPLEPGQKALLRDDVVMPPEVSGAEMLRLAEKTNKSYYLAPKNAGL